MKINISLFISLLGLTACTTHLKLSDLTPTEQDSYQNIISNDIDGVLIDEKRYRVIGDVEGYFCFRNTYKLERADASELQSLIMKSAQDDLRFKAAMLEADAVIGEECFREGVNWAKSCWASATCNAKPVKISP